MDTINRAMWAKLEQYAHIIELYTDYRVEAIVTTDVKDSPPHMLICDRKSEFKDFRPKRNRKSNGYHIPDILSEIYGRAIHVIALKFKEASYETQEERWRINDEIGHEIVRNNNWLKQFKGWGELTRDAVNELRKVKGLK